MPDINDRIRGAFLLCACGDALGAPVEHLRTLDSIRAAHGHGHGGIQDIIAYHTVFDGGRFRPAGSITDDTAMTMTVAAAIGVAATSGNPRRDLPALLWQGFINWGQHQDGGGDMAKKIDKNILWPDAVRAFWHDTGAGRGTIAALLQDKPGSVAAPQQFDMTLRGQRVTSPNRGCGGMMRAGPLGLLPLSPEEIFEIACESAAITNGDPAAYCASGAVALYTHFALGVSQDNADIVTQTQAVLSKYAHKEPYAAGVAACLRVIDIAARAGTCVKAEEIDALPAVCGFKNPFTALPVLAQVTSAVLQAPVASDVRRAMILAVNHCGDSDSVGAITGHILGARHGISAVPQDWVRCLPLADDVQEMAAHISAAIVQIKPAPRVKPPAPSL
jgi:ADP-ribosylglycohydrolase